MLPSNYSTRAKSSRLNKSITSIIKILFIHKSTTPSSSTLKDSPKIPSTCTWFSNLSTEENFSHTSDQLNHSPPIRPNSTLPLSPHASNTFTARTLSSEISNQKIFSLLTMDILSSQILGLPRSSMKEELSPFVEPLNTLLQKSS